MLVHSGPFMNDAILPTLASFRKWINYKQFCAIATSSARKMRL
jgi:hypothetical protein